MSKIIGVTLAQDFDQTAPADREVATLPLSKNRALIALRTWRTIWLNVPVMKLILPDKT